MAMDALQLRAETPEDLVVLSACLQDALIMIGDIAYRPDERRLMLAANRFLWEAPDKKSRCLSGLTIERVTAVRRRRLDPRRREALLSLLAIRGVPGGLELIFAGGAEIRVETEGIDIRLEDVGQAWPTLWQPSHA